MQFMTVLLKLDCKRDDGQCSTTRIEIGTSLVQDLRHMRTLRAKAFESQLNTPR
jgi:hypothetical protein